MAKQDLSRIPLQVPVIQKTSQKKRLPVDNHFYLFQDSSGNSHKLASECLISTRAEDLSQHLWFILYTREEKNIPKHMKSLVENYFLPEFRVPPYTTLRFYNTPGTEPGDGASVQRFHDSNQYSGERFYDVRGGDKCKNLLIRKYQDNKSPAVKVTHSSHDITAKEYPVESYDSLNPFPYDIVTVRNRLLDGQTTLFHLITAMEKANYRYTTYHCLFSPAC
jgi:hypothetical protein